MQQFWINMPLQIKCITAIFLINAITVLKATVVHLTNVINSNEYFRTIDCD